MTDLAALNKAVQASSAAPAVKKWIDAATPLIQPPAPPTKYPPAMWPAAQNPAPAAVPTMQAMKACGAGAIYGACAWMPTSGNGWGSQLTNLGLKAIATVGGINADGSWTYSNAQALQVATAAVQTGAVSALVIADEPSPTYADKLKARYQLLKPLGVPVTFTYYDAASVGQLAGCADYLLLDIYPARFQWNMALIPQLAAAADVAGIAYVGTVGIFTDGSVYPYPSTAQAQAMFAAWAATKQLGKAVYCWGSGGANPTLSGDPAMQAVVKANLS